MVMEKRTPLSIRISRSENKSTIEQIRQQVQGDTRIPKSVYQKQQYSLPTDMSDVDLNGKEKRRLFNSKTRFGDIISPKLLYGAIALILVMTQIWDFATMNIYFSNAFFSNTPKYQMFTVPTIRPVILQLNTSEFDLFFATYQDNTAGQAWDNVVDMTHHSSHHVRAIEQNDKIEQQIDLSEDEYNIIYHPMDSDEERERGKLILPFDYSEDALVGKRDKFIDGDCIQMEEWQLHDGFPTCNSIHEYDMAYTNHLQREETIKFLANGYWRDVWMVKDWDTNPFVLKTQRYEHDFMDRNFDRQRRDGLASERLTSSPYVVDIYAYCAYSGIYQYSEGGDIERMIWSSKAPEYSTFDALKAARDISAGIAAAHTFDGEYATLAHADITPGQFILINGNYRLNDFNRCRFIRWDTRKQQPCSFRIHGNPGTFRSPEEYNTMGEKNRNILTEKIDVFSMGNVYYSLLTKDWPFESFNHHEEKKAQRNIIHGATPYVSSVMRHSTDSSTQALMTAMKRCHILDPTERASAQEVNRFLSHAVEAIEKGEPFDPTSWVLD